MTRYAVLFFAAFTFAQRAFCAAAIRARADADNFLAPVPFPYAWPKAASAAPIPRSSLVNRSGSFFNNRPTPAKSFIEFPRAGLYQDVAAVAEPVSITEFYAEGEWQT